jgi:hypothetical protein
MKDWVTHFKNRPLLDLTDFEEERVSVMERGWLGYSVGQFMRGESSEARDFLEKSRRFAEESGEGEFLAASQIFVKEENYHSALLAAFMAQMGIEPPVESWADDAFRWVRSRGDIGWCSHVLLAAEILAQVYYPALQQATSSKMMAAICERIIEDEAYHILFQTERIARVLAHRGRIYRTVHSAAGWALFWGTAVVMWREHRPVLSRTLSFGAYLKQSFLRREYAMRQLRRRQWEISGPEGYEIGEETTASV